MSIEKRSYKMTDEQLTRLRSAAQGRSIYGQGGTPLFGDDDEPINNAWRELGEEMGFRWDTVRPDGKPQYFLAVPLKARA